MSKKESGGHETLWLWDGEDEYEGPLGVSGEHHLVARVRLVRRWTLASGAPGRPVPVDLLERQRALSRRICFAQSPAVLFGSLLEFRVAAVQPCRDRRFDFVLSGSFVPVAEEHLDALSRLSTPDGLRYLQARDRSEGAAAAR
jgi:hypothetical protein